MDFHRTTEQLLLAESVGKIAAQYGHGYYAEKARTGGHTTELWDAVGESGFIGVSLPEAHGGGGMGMAELAIVCEELAAQGCPLMLLVVSPAVCGAIITRHGSPAQQSRWLPGIASGKAKMVFAITEADAGSNAHRIATTAVADGDGYVLRGAKHYISGVDEADWVLVVAKLADGDRTRLGLFVVDTDAAGLTAAVIPVDGGIPERQFTLFLDEVRVPADRLVGGGADGLGQLFTGLNPERITNAAMAVGLARYALDKAAGYARERTVWNAPIGSHQGVAHPMATVRIDLELARLAAQKAAWLHDAGEDAGEASNMAKFAGARVAMAALDQAIQTHGGNGLATEYGLASIWGMVRLLRIAPVSQEMILNYVAIHTLGLPRSY